MLKSFLITESELPLPGFFEFPVKRLLKIAVFTYIAQLFIHWPGNREDKLSGRKIFSHGHVGSTNYSLWDF